MTPKSASKPTAKPTIKSAAKSKSVKTNFKSTSSSSRANSRELITSASTSIDPTTSPITLNQNTVDTKASNTSEAMVVDSNASTSVDSAANTGTTESIASETSADASTTTEQKVTDPAADAPSASEATFELFPKLPAELRIKIWKLVPAPRIVVVRFYMDGRKRTHKFAASLPVILHACQESRHEALKIYHRAFNSKRALNGVYFNFKSDILVLSYASLKAREFFLRKLKPHDLSRIERIALRYAELGSVPKLVGLKEVIYTIHPTCFHLYINSYSDRDGSILTLEELLESNPDDQRFRFYLKRAQLRFSKDKESFEDSEDGSKISIRQGLLCLREMYREGHFFHFR